ncbi:MFS transporter [Bacillus sp. SN10]|uniref:MFS transporter n=1 Tax=Bacillus sp. SN10 TaxID=2056493 RepID=UPI000C32C0D6|nr:MFS transporter [Bacillus sp. SN10]PKJ54482.1 MFS transporter [Bacillus sp. SN10]
MKCYSNHNLSTLKTLFPVIIALCSQTIQNSIIFLSLAWYFTSISSSPFIYGSIMMFRYIPGILLTMISGIAIDNMNKVTLGILANTLNLLSVVCLLIVSILEVPISGIGYWVYTSIVIINGVSISILIPLEKTLIVLLTTREKLKAVNSLVSIVTQLSNLLGTSLAGVLLLLGGVSFGISTAIVTSIVSLTCYTFWLNNPKQPEIPSNSKGSFFGALKSSITILNKKKWIFIAIIPTIFTNMSFVIIMDVVLPYLFSGLKINGSAALGICFTVMGLGTLLGATFTYRLSFINFDTSVILYLISCSIGCLAVVFTNSILVSIILFGLFSLLATPISIIFQTELQQIIPTKNLGSAMGLIASAVTIAQPLGVFLGGLFLSKFNGSILLFIACFISIISVLLGWSHIRIEKKAFI